MHIHYQAILPLKRYFIRSATALLEFSSWVSIAGDSDNGGFFAHKDHAVAGFDEATRKSLTNY
jgi:hypothetical protein